MKITFFFIHVIKTRTSSFEPSFDYEGKSLSILIMTSVPPIYRKHNI